MAAEQQPLPPVPKSLDGREIPRERLEQIAAHMAMLAETALAVSNTLPLQADGGDFVAVMDREGE